MGNVTIEISKVEGLKIDKDNNVCLTLKFQKKDVDLNDLASFNNNFCRIIFDEPQQTTMNLEEEDSMDGGTIFVDPERLNAGGDILSAVGCYDYHKKEITETFDHEGRTFVALQEVCIGDNIKALEIFVLKQNEEVIDDRVDVFTYGNQKFYTGNRYIFAPEEAA